jgi:hypothetical protein
MFYYWLLFTSVPDISYWAFQRDTYDIHPALKSVFILTVDTSTKALITLTVL